VSVTPEAVQRLLDVEVALASALADAGVIPAESVEPIRVAARADRFALDELDAATERAGNLVIPVVAQLATLVGQASATAAGYVHLGATSQDILDTAMVLVIRDAASTLHHELGQVMTRAAALARDHAFTPMPGRTWLQQASPVSFGLKAAGWLDLVGRCRERAAEASRRAMVVQLGGASGTLATLGERGPAVVEAFAKRLALSVPEMPWHTQRDRVVDVASVLGLVCGALGKVGRDLSLLAQTEIGEVSAQHEPGRGGSSSMPHKQNPVRAVRLVAAATRAPGLVSTMLSAMPQEHERAAGGWQAEWETLPALIELTIDAARTAADALEHLEVDRNRMEANLASQGGVALSESLTAAVAAHTGRPAAMVLVERLSRAAVRDGRTLQDVATSDPELSSLIPHAEIVQALTPARALGSAMAFIERVLAKWPV
jgi:3-carboxy-cis,cis-muconate cycloisomerase